MDRILHHPFYNRYTDKTQVFSLYKNDDITHRALHVQLVSRIARTIGSLLNLNLDLIEAIALGHDIGHTPFGHKGEEFLNEKYHNNTGKFFKHALHSVRTFMLTGTNLTAQTLDGILCHDGEKSFDRYNPLAIQNFDELNQKIESSYAKKDIKLVPSTLEGCVVRISDMIAYVGKDRQDAKKARLRFDDDYTDNILGKNNIDIMSNIIKNLVKNSYGKEYLKLDSNVSAALEKLKKENNILIYQDEKVDSVYQNYIHPMFHEMYDKLLQDVNNHVFTSPVFKHHIDTKVVSHFYKEKIRPYRIIESADNMVTDYIASMTDDYFLDLYSEYINPKSVIKIEYNSYFSNLIL